MGRTELPSGSHSKLSLESSRKAAKRFEQQCRAALVIAAQEGNEGIRIGDANAPMSQSINKNAQKKRGPTTLGMIKSCVSRLSVTFNELGQPVGENSDKYTSYLGVLAREMVPVVIKDWGTVRKEMEEELWLLIQQRFIVHEIHRHWTIQKIGECWRQFKSRITSKIREVDKAPNKAKASTLLKPTNVKSTEQWDSFVKERLFEDFEKQLEEVTQSSEHVDHENIRLDPLKIVFGSERRGRVRGKGFGVNPSQLKCSMQSSGKGKELESEMHTTKEQMKELAQKVEHMSSLLLKLSQNQSVDDMMSSHACTPRMKLWVKAQLQLQIRNPKFIMCLLQRIVGKFGYIITKNVELYRPTDEAKTLDQAVGSSIAWPKNNITFI